jgi:hypothetical protein
VTPESELLERALHQPLDEVLEGRPLTSPPPGTAPPNSRAILIGADIGQIHDPSALVVCRSEPRLLTPGDALAGEPPIRAFGRPGGGVFPPSSRRPPSLTAAFGAAPRCLGPGRMSPPALRAPTARGAVGAGGCRVPHEGLIRPRAPAAPPSVRIAIRLAGARLRRAALVVFDPRRRPRPVPRLAGRVGTPVLQGAVGDAHLAGMVPEGKLTAALAGLRQRHALAALTGCGRVHRGSFRSGGCCAVVSPLRGWPRCHGKHAYHGRLLCCRRMALPSLQIVLRCTPRARAARLCQPHWPVQTPARRRYRSSPARRRTV